MKIRINSRYKSIPAGTTFDLPDFSIITGKNGSGKSHLLEAMANVQTSTISDSSNQLNRIHFIGFGGLNPQMDESCDPQQIVQHTRSWWSQIQNIQAEVKQARDRGEVFGSSLPEIAGRRPQNPDLNNIIEGIMRRTSKSFEDLSEDDVYFNVSLSNANQNTLFASQFALIFKTYHVRYTKNKFKKFLNIENNTNHATLSDKEFLEKYGPKPWELVNKILANAGLTYEVINPEAIDVETVYRFRLIDRATAAEISVNDLSTGEKVLMSLALAIYNTQESMGKPDLLILDEPDAPLHPQYSKLLIDTLRDVVVKTAGVRVVVTTHSPSTAAMSPQNSLFEMNRTTKIPEMISVTRGIEVLTDGIPHLKVSIDSRRQIFVESRFDVVYLHRLYQIIERITPLKYNPVFLEPHSGTSNCSDVESIVSRLYAAGSDVVRGIIDWDGTKSDVYPVYVLGRGRRYAIENYILDPFYVGLALIRAGKRTLNDFTITHLTTYLDVREIEIQHAQIIADQILEMTGLKLEILIKCRLQNGWDIALPENYLHMRGHDWQELLLEKIPALKAVSSKNGDSGLKLGLLQVIEEFPQFLSADIAETFTSIN